MDVVIERDTVGAKALVLRTAAAVRMVANIIFMVD